jgi:ABC-type amino acid transport system permease subunit
MTTGASAITRLLNDTRSRSLFFQFLLLAGIVLGLWWIVDNTVTNLGQI